jgi:hypothetical protein
MWVEVLHLKLFNKHHPSNKVRHISTKHQTAQAKLKKFLFPLIFALWTNKQGCKSWGVTLIAENTLSTFVVAISKSNINLRIM